MSRSVIVTGGTGALGRSVARAFLEQGDRVVVPWIVPAEVAAMEKAFSAPVAEKQLTLVEADVSEDAGAERVVAEAGEPDVLFNGVGGFAGGPPVHETDLDEWDRMLRMNLRTAVAMVRATAPGMLARSRGDIVSVASQAVDALPAGLAAYAASKAAIVVLTRTLQKELGDAGIRVNAVAPGTIDTPANREAMPDVDPAGWTPPDRIAQVVCWLTSPAAATVRGAVIPV